MKFFDRDINWRAEIFPKRDDLPRDLTTMDYLKAIAVVLMLIDHIGFYLFPDIAWFRVIGRAGMPVWFFLVGYGRRQDLPPRWLVAGIILLVANLLVGLPPLPLSALFTLAICRLLVKPFWEFVSKHQVYMWWIVLLLLFVGPAADLLMEYGTFGFLIAAAAYGLRRHDDMVAGFGFNPAERLLAVVIGVFSLYQVMKFGFNPLEAIAMCAGMFATYWVLQSLQPKTFPGTANNAQAPLIRFMGRYTLEIYVIHLLILKGVFALQMIAKTIL